jgi:hypothetical protein
VAVRLDLLTPGIEVGLVTTNLDGVRYFTIGVNNLRAGAEAFGDSEYEVVEPVTEFAPVPGMGWMFVADPDGNWIELFGTL